MPANLGRDVLVAGVLCLGDGRWTAVSLFEAGIGFKRDSSTGFSRRPTPWGLQLSALNFWSSRVWMWPPWPFNLIHLASACWLPLRKRLEQASSPLRRCGQRHGPADGSGRLWPVCRPVILSNVLRWPARAAWPAAAGWPQRRPRPGTVWPCWPPAAGVRTGQQLSQQIRQRLSRRS